MTKTSAPYVPSPPATAEEDAWRLAAFALCTHYGMVMFALLAILVPEVLPMGPTRDRLWQQMIEGVSGARLPFAFTLIGAPMGLAIAYGLPRIVARLGRLFEPTFHPDCGGKVLDYVALATLVAFSKSCAMRLLDGSWFGPEGGTGSEAIYSLLVLADWLMTFAAAFLAGREIHRGLGGRPLRALLVFSLTVLATGLLFALTSAVVWGLALVVLGK